MTSYVASLALTRIARRPGAPTPGASPPEDPPRRREGLVLAALAFAAAAAAVPASAQEGPPGRNEGPVVVRSEVDRTTMAIGDQVLLLIVVDLAPGHDLQDPGVPRAIGDFEVVDTLSVLQTRGPSGATRIQLRYLITAFTLGEKQLPVIAVGYRASDGRTGTARTASGHVIQVQSVVLPNEDTGDIKPLKPPIPIPGSTAAFLARLVPAVAIGIAIVAAAVLALRLRRRGPAVSLEPTHGPARHALDELERVAELRLPELGRTREHYELVAAALRRYAAERFGVAAEARTARELRRELEHAGLGRSQAQVLYELLHDAESVRYQEQVIYPARAQKAMRDVLELMRKSVVTEEYELVESGAAS